MRIMDLRAMAVEMRYTLGLQKSQYGISADPSIPIRLSQITDLITVIDSARKWWYAGDTGSGLERVELEVNRLARNLGFVKPYEDAVSRYKSDDWVGV